MNTTTTAPDRYLMVHGSPGNVRDWDRLLALAPRQVEVVPYELPDHGARPESEASIQRFEDDLIEAARAAGPDLTLVGVSLGAYLVARVLPALGDRLRRAVLIAGFAELPLELVESREAMASAIERGELGWAELSQMVLALFLGSRQGPPERKVVEELLAEATPAQVVRGLRRFRQMNGPAARVGRYETPTVVLHATADPVLPLDLGRELAAQGSHAELVTLDADAHWLQVTHPAEVGRWVFGA